MFNKLINFINQFTCYVCLIFYSCFITSPKYIFDFIKDTYIWAKIIKKTLKVFQLNILNLHL